MSRLTPGAGAVPPRRGRSKLMPSVESPPLSCRDAPRPWSTREPPPACPGRAAFATTPPGSWAEAPWRKRFIVTGPLFNQMSSDKVFRDVGATPRSQRNVHSSSVAKTRAQVCHDVTSRESSLPSGHVHVRSGWDSTGPLSSHA